MSISQLYKTLLDTDPPPGGYGLAQDGWIPSFIGATQHLHLVDPATLSSAQSLGEHTNTLASVDTAANNDFLVYDGSDWRNMTLAAVQALFGAGFAVAGTANNGYVVTSVAGVPTWQAAGAGFTVSGAATNGYIVQSAAGTPTWVPYAPFTVAGTIGAGKVIGESGGVATWVTASGSLTGPVALRSNIASQASYDTIGGVSFYQAINGTGGGTNYTYFKVPAGYSKARVTVSKTEAGIIYVIRITPSSGVPPTDLPVIATSSTFTGNLTGVVTPVFYVAAGDYIFWGYAGETPPGYGAGHVVNSMQLELFV